MKKYFLHIFGCQMNYADAQRLATVFETLGWENTEDPEEADCYLMFTCSVRQKSEDKVFGYLKDLAKWKAKKPGRLLGITGCMVRQTSKQADEKRDPLLNRQPVLDFVLRIEDAAHLPSLVAAGHVGSPQGGDPIVETLHCNVSTDNEINDYFRIQPKYTTSHSVLIPIMTGCDNFCSYCIVPFARGRERSRPEEDVIKECEAAVRQGAVEITLLGQNVNSYQKTPGVFAALLEKVAQISDLQRIRFMSAHPKDFDDSVIEVMAKYPNIERHLHLPAQHGDNEILQKMNRSYTAEEYLEKLGKFRKALPEASITTDIIVGFPGETEKAFENLLKFYEEADFDFAYFAKYSPRPSTAAAKLEDDVSKADKSKRWNALNKLVVKTTTAKYKKTKGKTLEVLVEKCENGICEGRSSEFYLTKFKGNKDLIGKMVKVKITQPREVELVGKIS